MTAMTDRAAVVTMTRAQARVLAAAANAYGHAAEGLRLAFPDAAGGAALAPGITREAARLREAAEDAALAPGPDDDAPVAMTETQMKIALVALRTWCDNASSALVWTDPETELFSEILRAAGAVEEKIRRALPKAAAGQ